MKPILILYTSSTGNTEQIADLLLQAIEKQGFSATMREFDMEDLDVHLLQDYAGILFGTYTYDDGDLPFEIEVFHDDLAEIDLTGTIVGIFGSGDSSYDLFCGAVDLMKKQFEQTNATVIEPLVKVDLFPDEEEELAAINQLAERFLAALPAPPVQLKDTGMEKELR